MTTATIAQSLTEWNEKEARSAYADDQRRHPAPAAKAFYAILNDAEGTLTKAGAIYFIAADGSGLQVVISYAGLTVLGEVGLADTQKLMDELHHGFAAIACSRQMEVN